MKKKAGLIKKNHLKGNFKRDQLDILMNFIG